MSESLILNRHGPPRVRPLKGPDMNDLPEPIIIAHRGGGAIYPEECVWTYDKQLENFAEHAPDASLVLEADLQMLSGSGDLLVHHDSTFDRTTDATGSSGGVAGVRTLANYKDITVDHYWWNGSIFLPAEKLKMLTGREFIERYGHRGVLNFECKYIQTQQPLADLIREYRAERNSFVWVNTAQGRDFFLTRGIRVLANGDAIANLNAKQLETMGVVDIGGYIPPTDWNPAGWQPAYDYLAGTDSKFWIGGQRRREWKEWRDHADIHRGGYSDEPLWVTGKSPKYTTDQFAGRVHLPGHIAYGYEFPGNFKDLGGGVWGWGPNANQNGWCLWGWCSPHPSGGHGDWDVMTGIQETKEPTYPFGLEVDIKRISGTSPNHWASIAFADDDMPVHDSRSAGSNTSGRHVLFAFVNGSGDCAILDKLDAADTVLASGNLGNLGIGGQHRYRFEYLSATSFKVTDLTTGLSVTATIPANLGTNGYINAGTPNSGSGGEWAFSAVELF